MEKSLGIVGHLRRLSHYIRASHQNSKICGWPRQRMIEPESKIYL
jgi:hypothetical protein